MLNKALVIQSHIAQLAERVNTTFLETEEERVKLNDWEWERDPEFSILELIELYTPYVCGYAGQITSNGKVKTAREAATHLQNIQFFDKPEFLTWYLSPSEEYIKLKAYIETLDYLRLSTLQYIQSYQNNSHEARVPVHISQDEKLKKAA
jgi:hypothetical protein